MTNESRFADHLLTKPMKAAYVYFIQEGDDGPIKIGIAFDPFQRLGNMQVGNSRPLKLLHCLSDHGATEGRIQGIFEDSHLRGEWYNPTDDLLTFIADIKTKTDGRVRQYISRAIKMRQDELAKRRKDNQMAKDEDRKAFRKSLRQPAEGDLCA